MQLHLLNDQSSVSNDGCIELVVLLRIKGRLMPFLETRSPVLTNQQPSPAGPFDGGSIECASRRQGGIELNSSSVSGGFDETYQDLIPLTFG